MTDDDKYVSYPVLVELPQVLMRSVSQQTTMTMKWKQYEEELELMKLRIGLTESELLSLQNECCFGRVRVVTNTTTTSSSSSNLDNDDSNGRTRTTTTPTHHCNYYYDHHRSKNKKEVSSVVNNNDNNNNNTNGRKTTSDVRRRSFKRRTSRKSPTIDDDDTGSTISDHHHLHLSTSTTTTTDMLRNSLVLSFNNMDNIKQSIQENIAEIQWICKDYYPQAREHLKRSWGINVIVMMIDTCRRAVVRSMFDCWIRVVNSLKFGEKKIKYLQYQALCLISIYYKRMCLSRESKRWEQWRLYTFYSRRLEIRQWRNDGATRIQSMIRLYNARVVAFQLKQERSEILATKVQSHFRRFLTLKVYHKLLNERKEVRSIKRIQCAFRLTRAKCLLQEKKWNALLNRSATKLQKMARGKKGRAKASSMFLRWQRNNASVSIQKIYRGRGGRRIVQDLQLKMLRDFSATIIQKYTRRILVLPRINEMQHRRKERKELERKMTIVVQRAYRVHRTRIMTQLQMQSQLAIVRRNFRAVTSIQSLVRSVQAKKYVNALFEEQENDFIRQARNWQELWGEDANSWYYQNVETGQTLWAPPPTGYQKNDTRLVLENGKVVDDPEFAPEETEVKVCNDCEGATATRYCNECDDMYCTDCFIKAHPKGGKRELHTFARVGSIECEECLKCLATKWCTKCDDPFCDSCWERIHAKGNRTFHAFCSISHDGTVSPRAWGSNGQQSGIFSPGSGLYPISSSSYLSKINDNDQDIIPETDDANYYYTSSDDINKNDYEYNNNIHLGNTITDGYTGTNTVEEWVQYEDENGNPYYYNTMSGAVSYNY